MSFTKDQMFDWLAGNASAELAQQIADDIRDPEKSKAVAWLRRLEKAMTWQRIRNRGDNTYLTEGKLKRALDLSLSVLLIILTFPVLVLAIALVKLTSSGPAIYTEELEGKHGRRFHIYKIRTTIYPHPHRITNKLSRLTCADLCRVDWKNPNFTPIGRWLRRTCINRLPELWNVLRGEMSLVGSYPESARIAEYLEQKIDDYSERMSMLPGVTGLAQVQIHPVAEDSDIIDKLSCELYYMHKANIALDIGILLSTPLAAILRAVGLNTSVTSSIFFLPSVRVCRRFCKEYYNLDLAVLRRAAAEDKVSELLLSCRT